MRILLSVSLVVSFFLLPAPSRADFVISVGDGLGNASSGYIATPGGYVDVPVFAYVSSGLNRTLDTYNLAFDFDTPGFGYDSNSISSIDVRNGIWNAQINFDTAYALNEVFPGEISFDFIVSDTPNIDLSIDSTAPTHLFDLRFTTTSETPANYRFLINPLNMDESIFPIGGGDFVPATNLTSSLGSVVIQSGSIVAAPEPSSMALLGLVAFGGAAYRRLRKKAPKSNDVEPSRI